MKYKEALVCHVHDLHDGEMKQVTVDGTDILLVRLDGKFYATSAYCTHYGAPLAEGVLCGQRVVCPWHQACFNVSSGEVEEPPALDNLLRFQVRVEGDQVFVRIPEQATDRAVPVMAKHRPEVDGRTFVIVGAGAAGLAAAETLRHEGFEGRLIMITRESQVPYDRPNLSKGFITGTIPEEWMPLRTWEFFKAHDIELWTGKEVIRIDALGLGIYFKDGTHLAADELLVATGGRPRRLQVEGSTLPGIYTLRTYADALNIRAALEQAEQVVVIGASFIGMESAASMRAKGHTVIVVAPEQVPFERAFGSEVGKVFLQMHQEQGVRFQLGHTVKRFIGDEKVSGVELDDGTVIPADVVLVGIGVEPVTDIIEGVPLHEDGSIPVNACLCTGKGLFAAGDIARFPDWRTGFSMRIEHWRVAMQQGRIAARNMLGIQDKFTTVPFFWTRQFEVSLQYVGFVSKWDEVIIHGQTMERSFIAYYVKKGKILAAAGMGKAQEMAAIEELMRLNQLPDLETLRAGEVNPVELLACT